MRLCHTSITVESLSTMKGFNELTQGEERIENMLLDNCLKLRGQNVGFKKTRTDVVTNEFSRNTLEDFVNMAITDCHMNEFLLMGMRTQAERVIRHYIPIDWVETFAETVKTAVTQFGFEETCNGIERYFTCGTLGTVKNTYEIARKYLDEGVIPGESKAN
ncbi:hypothetical protein [Bacillus sp. S0628]|uniref:hypothetical protein n=1 Tax=Bacillus sp. S0628 TaxID=2957802 RepID=UPI00209E3D37|nr:hypothetical protein [Bacillus sp. S0628]MCP1324336.1 hypothetical protein [Bacillus sp. S0628]